MLLVLLIWIVKFFELGSGIDLSEFGVYPRKVYGLIGILTAPLIHDDVKHAFANSVPLLVLGFLMYNAYRKVAIKSVLIIWLLSGLGIWLIGRPAYHIGASGVVFGINFFIFFSGLFRLDMRSLALSLLVAFAYGSMVWGIFPVDWKISFEAHAMGALSGVVLAWLYREVDRPPAVHWDDEETDGQPSLQPAPMHPSPSSWSDTGWPAAGAVSATQAPAATRLEAFTGTPDSGRDPQPGGQPELNSELKSDPDRPSVPGSPARSSSVDGEGG